MLEHARIGASQRIDRKRVDTARTVVARRDIAVSRLDIHVRYVNRHRLPAAELSGNGYLLQLVEQLQQFALQHLDVLVGYQVHVAERADGIDPALGAAAVEHQRRRRHQLRFLQQVAVTLQKRIGHFHILEFSRRTIDEPLLVKPLEEFEIGKPFVAHVKHPRERVSGNSLLRIRIRRNLPVKKGVLIDNARIVFERRMVIVEAETEKHVSEIDGPDGAVERKIHLSRKHGRFPESEGNFAAQTAVSRFAADVQFIGQYGRRIGIFRGTYRFE